MVKPSISVTIDSAPEMEVHNNRVFWRMPGMPVEYSNMSIAVAMETYARLGAAIGEFHCGQRAAIAKLSERGPMFLREYHGDH